jgi:chemotaxis protein CheZ
MPEAWDRRQAKAVRAPFADRLAALRAEHRDATTPEAVGEVVHAILASMHGDLSRAETSLLAEVEQIGRTIAAAKQEIASLQVGDINGSFIPSATDELDAIVEATARATNEILDACETCEAISGTLDADAAAALQAATTRIYEACSFQDITGQRITKVVSALKSIEQRIAAIIDTFGDRFADAARPAPAAAPAGEAALLNGPQLPGNGVDQAEIDRLLASFD